jgi:uncharacterized iron-regulated membrane protein
MMYDQDGLFVVVALACMLGFLAVAGIVEWILERRDK